MNGGHARFIQAIDTWMLSYIEGIVYVPSRRTPARTNRLSRTATKSGPVKKANSTQQTATSGPQLDVSLGKKPPHPNPISYNLLSEDKEDAMATVGLKGIWGLEQLDRTGIATWKLGVLLIGASTTLARWSSRD